MRLRSRRFWMVVSLAVGVVGFGSFHPLGGEEKLIGNIATSVGVLGVFTFLVLGAVGLYGRLGTGGRSTRKDVSERARAHEPSGRLSS